MIRGSQNYVLLGQDAMQFGGIQAILVSVSLKINVMHMYGTKSRHYEVITLKRLFGYCDLVTLQ